VLPEAKAGSHDNPVSEQLVNQKGTASYPSSPGGAKLAHAQDRDLWSTPALGGRHQKISAVVQWGPIRGPDQAYQVVFHGPAPI
jgi:hypothetical protein